MAELHIGVNDQLLTEIRSNMGLNASVEDIVQEALVVFLWATGVVAQGRVLLSANEDRSHFERVVLACERERRDKEATQRRTHLRLVASSKENVAGNPPD